MRSGAALRDYPGAAPELLAHIAPVAYVNINFGGMFRFPFKRYGNRLMLGGGAPGWPWWADGRDAGCMASVAVVAT